MVRILRVYINANALQDSGHIQVNSTSLVEFRAEGDKRSHGPEQVGAERDPDLCLHRALAGAAEGLEPEVLLDPLEEQLDLPARLVDLRYHDGVELEVVGEEDQRLSGFGIHVSDAPQSRLVQALDLQAVEPDGLVDPQSDRLVHNPGFPDIEAHVRLRPYDEECVGGGDAGEALEVEVPSIHHVEGPHFEGDPIQGVHVVDFGPGDRHECRDWAA